MTVSIYVIGNIMIITCLCSYIDGLVFIYYYAILEVSKMEGSVGQSTNVVAGGVVTDDTTDDWLTLDRKV